MPDLDIVNPIALGWHTPYKLVLGGAEPAEVGRAALRALAKSLRRGHGLGSLSALAFVARDVMADRLPAPDALDRLHAIERESGGDRHTKVAVQTVERIIAEAQDESPSTEDLSNSISARFCEELLAHHLYGPAWMEVLQERFPASGEAQAFADAVAAIVEPGLLELGRKLARNPEAARLRAPTIRARSKRSTAELLEQTIDLEEE